MYKYLLYFIPVIYGILITIKNTYFVKMSVDTNKTTVLLTGAAGYIGSHTALELLALNYSVVAIDNCVNAYRSKSKQKPDSLLVVEEISQQTVHYYEVDLMDEEELLSVFDKHRIDVVVHFAALKAVGESVSQPLQYYKNNMIGTMNLIEAMQRHNVNKIVFSSSATVYGTPQYLPMDESHPTGQGVTNPYGQTKQMCEQILKDVAHSDKNFKVVLLRYFNPVGAHESGRIGEDPKGKPNNLMPYIAQVAVGKRPHVDVFGSDYDTRDGTGIRDYIHVVDLAKGHVAALRKLESSSFKGCVAYNLGSGDGVSVLEMIKAYSKAAGVDIPYKLSPRRAGDVATVVAKCDLAEEELKWRAEKNLHQMCVDSWRWQKTNPEGFNKG